MVNKLIAEPNFTLGVTGWRDTNAVWVHGDGFSTAYSLDEAKELAANILATVKQIENAKPKVKTQVEKLNDLPLGTVIVQAGRWKYVKVGNKFYEADGSTSYPAESLRNIPVTVNGEPL